MEDKETGNTLAAVNCYFMAQDGGMFKAQVPFAPYFYLQAKVWPHPCRPPARAGTSAAHSMCQRPSGKAGPAVYQPHTCH